MPHALFISDLHLCPTRPEINQAFLTFLSSIAVHAQALYILGDLFEYWAGDDDIEQPLHIAVANQLLALNQKHVQTFFMHGNRDFLIAQKFAERAALTLIPDPKKVNLYGTDTLLMHGDTLCTDDVPYLEFRAMVRDEKWQQEFLAQPLAARHQVIKKMRATSETAKSTKSLEIMDVNETAVRDTFKKFKVPRIIHGHTHRPACHLYTIGAQLAERWVLSDWYKKGGYLRCDEKGCSQITL